VDVYKSHTSRSLAKTEPMIVVTLYNFFCLQSENQKYRRNRGEKTHTAERSDGKEAKFGT
jgi:hypothetical protein